MNVDTQAVENELKEIKNKLGSTELISRPDERKILQNRSAQLEEALKLSTSLAYIDQRLQEARDILDDKKEADLHPLARDDIKRLEAEKKEVETSIVTLLTEKPRKRIEHIIIEIRPAAGGEEAALFVAELFRMYQYYAKKNGWELTLLDSDVRELGGYKNVIFLIRGIGAYDIMKYEGGVHRIQRIPETEKSGRIHTSTATVAVLPYIPKQDYHIDPKEIRIDVYRASGPGGQYVNRRDSAVRILHLPTGIMATSQTARTQIQNRENALSILAAKLAQLEKEKQELALGEQRKTQMGSGDRSEKIRTYNFPQDRITDHRINKSWHNIEKILNGGLDPIFEALKKHQ